VLSAAETLRRFPGIRRKRLSGGALWHDYQAIHPDRMNWSVALAASEAGATLVNGAEATGPLFDSGRVSGARVRDCETGVEHDVQAAATLICAGTRLESVLGAFGVAGAPPLLRAMNVLVDRPAGETGVASPGMSGRMLTAVPWRGFVLAGTHQSRDVVPPSETAPPAAHLDEMIADVNAAFPGLEIGWPDVRLVHYGLTPAIVHRGVAELMPESMVRSHAGEGRPGLLSVVGVKFTTARWTAETAVDLVCAELSRTAPRSRTAETALPFAVLPSKLAELVDTLTLRYRHVTPEAIGHVVSWYGDEAEAVLTFASERGLVDTLGPTVPVLSGEIAYAAVHSQARHLADAVLRRTALGSTGHPGTAALARAAAVVAELLSWSAERTASEIALVERRYPSAASYGTLNALKT
jgi:glycerol-3-phosphate dehydrogenase